MESIVTNKGIFSKMYPEYKEVFSVEQDCDGISVSFIGGVKLHRDSLTPVYESVLVTFVEFVPVIAAVIGNPDTHKATFYTGLEPIKAMFQQASDNFYRRQDEFLGFLLQRAMQIIAGIYNANSADSWNMN